MQDSSKAGSKPVPSLGGAEIVMRSIYALVLVLFSVSAVLRIPAASSGWEALVWVLLAAGAPVLGLLVNPPWRAVSTLTFED